MDLAEEAFQGVCPRCKSESIKWGESEIETDYHRYHGICEDCGLDISEEHTLVFSQQVVVTEDGSSPIFIPSGE